ncbi:hypothetical protein SERLA73DRAFT_149653 [Serpula lacrymans var. lacrymans S7.3]|uniref:Uncharacterized protein n=2 Tax=Serpula lacrymans var. lacrymans TaxID=341189 RepID=F8PK45_SERL3|nr:uncharacterized protein SERLADRAFT_405203 [Serpula lacrymans var. lacrymans S7.9]EGO03285.1 hypothetical protein SERLA73DRAFT_149653 [Serpula lacrymans var. lacrymans S7.3]EGO29064.1 hypothetical protein SERLADRAFT_405203 [Serpula lacrymans var. lacrymans S7.9]
MLSPINSALTSPLSSPHLAKRPGDDSELLKAITTSGHLKKWRSQDPLYEFCMAGKKAVVLVDTFDLSARLGAPPIPRQSSKANRGLNHPQLARALCPMKWVELFGEDPQAGMMRLQDGTWLVIAANWPTMLYTDGAIYNEQDPLDMVANRPKSKIFGLTEVTPESWAWSLCSGWFSLNSCQSFQTTIGLFQLEEYFNIIIETLSDPDDEWAVEILSWLTEQVYGKRMSTKPTITDDTNTDLAKIRAKCAARQLAKAHVNTEGNAQTKDFSGPSNIATLISESAPQDSLPVLTSMTSVQATTQPTIPTNCVQKQVQVTKTTTKTPTGKKNSTRPKPKPITQTRTSACQVSQTTPLSYLDSVQV